MTHEEMRELYVEQSVRMLDAVRLMHKAKELYNDAKTIYDEAAEPLYGHIDEMLDEIGDPDTQEQLMREACDIGGFDYYDPAFALIRQSLDRLRNAVDFDSALLAQLRNAPFN